MIDYIYAAALFALGCFGVCLIWLMKQPLPPERSELDNDQPPVRVKMWMGERE
jgi:hypothetical protein